MSNYELNLWEEFEPALNEIRKKYPKERILYRGGGADEEFYLKTSLERFSKKPWTFKKYSLLAWNILPHIEAHLEKKMNLPDREEIVNSIEKENRDYLRLPLPVSSYFIYLRQHGFPSPLLDWTSSPYIAAYFAFAERKENAGKNAIYIFIKGQAEVYEPKHGYISLCGHNINTDKRHFLQQACYTIAAKSLTEKNDWEFVNHNDFFDKEIDGEDSGVQDILVKVTLPASERMKVLTCLDQHNLNQFSLFQTEDDLIKTIIFREMEKEQEVDRGF